MRGKNIGLYIGGILSGIFMFLFAYPYYMWEHETLNHFLRLIFGVVLILNIRNNKSAFLLFWVLLLLYMIIAVGNSIIASAVFVFSCMLLLSTKTEYTSITYKTFYNVFVLFAFLSMVNYVLVLLGISMPSHVIEPLNEAKSYNYIAYPFMVMNNKVQDFYRFEGVFDEPGALATYCFLLLWAEKFNYLKWKNIIILAAGVLSLSLFFYIAIGIVMIIKIFSKGTSILFRVLSVGLISIFVFSLTIEDSITSTVIGERLEFDEEKGFKGNNRSTDALDIYYEKVRWQEPVFYWGPTIGGANKEYVASQVEGAAGYKRAFLEVGLVGCILFFMFFFFYANFQIKRKKDLLLFLLCFLMTLYQRPFFTDIVYLFMFSSIIQLHDFQPEDSIEKKPRRYIKGKNVGNQCSVIISQE